jgi:hypothetical protein
MARATTIQRMMGGAMVAALVSGGGYLPAQEDVLVPAPEPIELTVQNLAGTGKRRHDVLIAFTDDEKKEKEDAAHSEYWLGVQLAALPELARQQLGVDYGLAVEDITPDSPAAKAEIKPHDILVKAGDVPLKEAGDLVKVVEGSQGKEITITIVRGGKDRTITVTPAKRPERERTITVRGRGPELDTEIKRLEEALENLKNKAGKEGFGMYFPRPAIVAPKLNLYRSAPSPKDLKDEFPKDLSVQINKEGDQPVKIHVQRGGKEWDVTEDKLSDLPDDVRPHVQKLLGRMLAPGFAAAAQRILRVTPEGKVEGELRLAPNPPNPPAAPRAPRLAAPSAPPSPPVPPASGAVPQRAYSFRLESSDRREGKLDPVALEDKLTAIMKKLDELRKDVDELRGKSDRR